MTDKHNPDQAPASAMEAWKVNAQNEPMWS